MEENKDYVKNQKKVLGAKIRTSMRGQCGMPDRRS